VTADSKANRNVQHAEGSDTRLEITAMPVVARVQTTMVVGETITMQTKDLEERQITLAAP